MPKKVSLAVETTKTFNLFQEKVGGTDLYKIFRGICMEDFATVEKIVQRDSFQ